MIMKLRKVKILEVFISVEDKRDKKHESHPLETTINMQQEFDGGRERERYKLYFNHKHKLTKMKYL